MKNVKFHSIRSTVLCAVLATAGLTGAYAQGVVTTTTSAGTVSEFSPDAITVTSGTSPVSYTYSKTTTYVDENGNPVSAMKARESVRLLAPTSWPQAANVRSSAGSSINAWATRSARSSLGIRTSKESVGTG